jgi:hypothetical protein
MKKLYTSILTFLTLHLGAYAQMNYTFTSFSGMYAALAGGTSPTLTPVTGYTASDEGYSNGILIGFPFDFNGTSYTQVNINSNGFVSFGAAFTNTDGWWSNGLQNGPFQYNASTSTTTPLPAHRPLIAPLWDDLDLQTPANLKYELNGSAPSRVFTIEWSNAKWDFNASTAVVSFQLKLYETSNVIEFVYEPLAGSISAGSASIGLAGIGSGPFKPFISIIDTNNIASPWKILEWNNSIKPPSGTTFRFTPSAVVTNDLAIAQQYSFGKVPTNQDAQVTAAMVVNLGSATATNIPVTLAITGAYSFSNIQMIASLAPGDTATVSFPPYLPTAPGIVTSTVSLPSDQDNTNNSVALPQEAAADFITHGHFAPGSFWSSSISSSNGGTFAAKIKNTGAKFVQTVGFIVAGATPQPVRIMVYEDNGTNGIPGTTVFQSASFTPPATGLVTFTLPTSAAVTGDFYVGIKQATATSMQIGREWELPYLRKATYYLGGLGPWSDLATVANGSFKPVIATQYGLFPLPVSLISFTGRAVKGENQLEWKAENEKNNHGFEIERSSDAEVFEKIAFVPAQHMDGNTMLPTTYHYNDKLSVPGTHYYRLKQLDLNGTFTYSNVITIKQQPTEPIEIVTLTPNPASSFINLHLNHTCENATVQITDLTGKILKEALLTNTVDAKLDISSLSGGFYSIKVITENQMLSSRFIKN